MIKMRPPVKMRWPAKAASGEDESIFNVFLMPGRYVAFKIEG
jgi:hypothetical protein